MVVAGVNPSSKRKTAPSLGDEPGPSRGRARRAAQNNPDLGLLAVTAINFCVTAACFESASGLIRPVPAGTLEQNKNILNQLRLEALIRGVSLLPLPPLSTQADARRWTLYAREHHFRSELHREIRPWLHIFPTDPISGQLSPQVSIFFLM